MPKPTRALLALLALSALLPAAARCAGQKAECAVSFDNQGVLHIIVNPPGESGPISLDGSLQRDMSLSSGQVITTYDGELVKTYQNSGAAYTIQVHIETADERVRAYTLEVTGGVYGSAPHTCSE